MKKLMMCMAIAISASQASFAAPDTHGLIAYYSFDGDYLDRGPGASLHWNAGSGMNFTTGVDGNNQAADFSGNGNSHLSRPAIANYAATTVAFWFRTDNPHERELIYTPGDGPDLNGGLMIGTATFTRQPHIELAIGFTNARNSSSPVVISHDISSYGPNDWHHFAGVFEAGNRMAIYLDGVQVTEKTTGVPGSYVSNPMVMGTNPRTPLGRGYNFSGAVDELAIYNKALGDAEIQTLMNDPFAPAIPAPLAAVAGLFLLLIKRSRRCT